MIARWTDKVDRLAARYAKAIAFISIGWMVAVALDYGRIIDLPELPFLSGLSGIVAAGLFNAWWWGFARRRVEQHRQTRGVIAGAGAETRRGARDDG